MDLLAGLELTKSQYEWLERRFDNMTAAEKLKFAGAMDILRPADVETVIRTASQMEYFSLLLGAGDDKALGQYVLEHYHMASRKALPFLDPERAGRQFRAEHGGSFQGGCLVQQTSELDISEPLSLPHLPTAGDYAIRVKLASRSNTEGVWVGFPDCGESMAGLVPDELTLALEALQAKSAGECIALEMDWKRTEYVMANTVRFMHANALPVADTDLVWARGVYIPPDEGYNHRFAVDSPAEKITAFMFHTCSLLTCSSRPSQARVPPAHSGAGSAGRAAAGRRSAPPRQTAA